MAVVLAHTLSTQRRDSSGVVAVKTVSLAKAVRERLWAQEESPLKIVEK
jgi:hypothetical protein